MKMRASTIVSAPSVPTPITPIVSPGAGFAPEQAPEDDRGGLDQHRRVERDVFGEPVDDAPRGEDELAVPAAAREAELVVVLAEMGVPGAAAAAHPAVAEALTDDAVAGRGP